MIEKLIAFSVKNRFLHNQFQDYTGLLPTKDVTYIARKVDDGLKEKYHKNEGNISTFISSLRKLFSWYNDENQSYSKSWGFKTYF